MSEIRAFRVDPQNVNMKKKELIDATITRIGKCGNILERRRIERGEKAEEFMSNMELTERNLKGGEGI